MGKKFRTYEQFKEKPIGEPIEEETVVVEVEEPVEKWVDANVNGVDSMLNIRSSAEVANNVIGLFGEGTPCKVLKPNENSDWYRIIIGEPEVKGYAMKKYIKVS